MSFVSHNAIERLRAAKQVARDKYAWPGGYPLFLLTSDGAAICPECVRSEFRCIAYSAITGQRDGWQPEAAAVNWEDSNLSCDHCSEKIESAYGE